MILNDRFLRALQRKPVDRTPIWLMRQAGRYLPEYRQLRATAGNFLNLCKTPELACIATLQPIIRFPLDAAIIFSDILTIPDAMRLGLHFVENEGPRFSNPICTLADIEALPTLDNALSLEYVAEAIRLVQHELREKIPLIGFSGSPWTLACYMLENGSSRIFQVIKTWLFKEPNGLKLLLEKLTVAVTQYLILQIEAGVQVLMLFDTWGGILSPQNYIVFSLYYMRNIITEIQSRYHHRVPIILFTKNGGQWLEAMIDSNADALGLDWTTDIGLARTRVGQHVALQGNLDPAVLYAKPEQIASAVWQILKDYGPHSGHIFNLGHGVQPETSVERVSLLIDTVHQLSTIIHTQ